MGVAMLVIFAYHVIYGYIHLKIGAIITAFLPGLFPGAHKIRRVFGAKEAAWITP